MSAILTYRYVIVAPDRGEKENSACEAYNLTGKFIALALCRSAGSLPIPVGLRVAEETWHEGAIHSRRVAGRAARPGCGRMAFRQEPTAAVRTEFPEGSIGAIKQVSVAIAHNGGELAFRLEWSDASAESGAGGQDDVGFPDAAAILLPVRPGAPLMTMGAPGQPVNAWYWRADENGTGRQVTAQGLGTTETIDRESVKCRGIHRQSEWAVVIARHLRVKGNQQVAQIDVGTGTAFSIAANVPASSRSPSARSKAGIR